MDSTATNSKVKLTNLKNTSKTEKTSARLDIERTVEWIGGVSQERLYHALSQIKSLVKSSPSKPITMIITSPGGPTGVAMSFFDTVNKIFKAKLHTIGSGDVDSSGVILLMAGEKRSLTSNTTILLHMAGRRFDSSIRYTTSEMSSMLEEDHLKDHQYASIIAEKSEGKLVKDEVLDMMKKGTILDAQTALELGLVHEII